MQTQGEIFVLTKCTFSLKPFVIAYMITNVLCMAILNGFYAYNQLYIESHNGTVDLLLMWGHTNILVLSLQGSNCAAVYFEIQ